MKYLKYIIALTLVLAFTMPSEAQKRRRPSSHRKKSSKRRKSSSHRKKSSKRRKSSNSRHKKSGKRRHSSSKFTNKKQYWSIGGTLNVMNYFGDIAPKTKATSTDLKFTRPQFGAFFVKRLNSRISFRGMLTYGTVAADDFSSGNPNTEQGRRRYLRNLHFRSRITEFSGTFMIDFLENKGVFYRRPKIPIPYFMVGFGAFLFNPQAQPPGGGEWTDLQPLATEGVSYSKLAFTVPLGVGVRYKLTPNLDLSFEIGWRQTNTDYLDDVSGFYPDLSTLDPEAVPFAMRALETTSALTGEIRNINVEGVPYPGANGDYLVPAGYYPKENVYGDSIVDPRGGPDNDVYVVSGFHLSYIFSGGIRTPKFRR